MEPAFHFDRKGESGFRYKFLIGVQLFRRARGHDKMRRKKVESTWGVLQLSFIPVMKVVRVRARRNEPRIAINFANSLAERFGSLRGGWQCGISDLPVAPQFVAELP